MLFKMPLEYAMQVGAGTQLELLQELTMVMLMVRPETAGGIPCVANGSVNDRAGTATASSSRRAASQRISFTAAPTS